MAVTEKEADAGGADTPSTGSSDPLQALSGRAWWHRHLEPEERRRVLTDLAISRTEHWGFRFTVMLTLSVIVAVMGLSANSAAVVIGAMLLAPLMGPVLATAACLSMALFRKSFSFLAKVLLATAWCIALSYLLAKLFVPEGPLPDEVVSRTKPDIRDLVVALGAGAAGSYATVRKDASAALPGVAVAVALVPPLGTVGIALDAGNQSYAQGALLLYMTNLAAIISASVIVFIVTGFVPPRRLASQSMRLLLSKLIVIALVVGIAIPLYRASQSAVEATNRQTEANDIVDSWLGDLDEDREVDLGRLDEGRILVEVRSFEPPLDEQFVVDRLKAAFGRNVAVSVRWDRIERAQTTTTEAPTTTVLSDEQILFSEVETVVQTWLDENDDGRDYELDKIIITGDTVRVDAAGVGEPPSLTELEERLQTELEQVFAVRLNWTERRSVTPGVTEPTPTEVLTQQMRTEVEAFANADPALVLERFTFDGQQAIIDFTGPNEPEVTGLVDTLHALNGAEFPVNVFFTQRQLVTTTTADPDAEPTTTTG